MIKTITILDNEDDTKKVYLNNFEFSGSQIKVDRANIKFNVIKLGDFNNGYNAKMLLEVNCLVNNKDQLYSAYYPQYDISHASDKELLSELKKRDILKEETVYKIN